MKLTVASSPHIRGNFQTRRIMLDVVLALMPALIMGIAVFGCYWALTTLLHISSSVILCGGPILVGVAVYVVCISVFKSITREDCLLLPKGEKIANLLRL